MNGKWVSVLIKKIEVRSGIVSGLETELTEYVNPEKPTHDDSPIYFKRMYQAKFRLGNEAIKVVFSKPIQIQNGDQLRVTGYLSGSEFTVLAYWNQTKQSKDSENWAVLAIGALCFLGVALFLLNSNLAESGAFTSTVMLVGFIGLGIYMIYKALLIRQALQLLNAIQ